VQPAFYGKLAKVNPKRKPTHHPAANLASKSGKPARPAGRGAKPGEVRIIGGRWRSRRIDVPTAEGLRPTGDRIRETVFNWVGPTLAGRRCLDLFAGTGVLGLEALSRGAASVDWVERNAPVARRLKETLDAFQASDPVVGQGAVHTADALAYVDNDRGGVFDLVFLDPPFALNLWTELWPRLEQRIADGGMVYVEAPAPPPTLSPPPEGWLIIRQSRAGAVWFALLQREYSQGNLLIPAPTSPS
jgi:16S rRNA (guanine966-N2)-methyltransferase